jgi:transcriptional regulator PpsR
MSTINLVQPDVTIRLDCDGIIQDTIVSERIASETLRPWHGRRWAETVSQSALDKLRHMVQDALTTGVSAFTPIGQCFPSGLEMPLEYTAVSLGGDSGLIAIGRQYHVVSELESRLLATQKAMEQNHWKLRDVETRYNVIFNAAIDPVLLIEVDTLRIIDANPAANRTLGIGPNWNFLTEIAEIDRAPFLAMMDRAREYGQAPGVIVHLGADRRSWIVRTATVESVDAPSYLLYLTQVGALDRLAETPHRPACAPLISKLPDGFVIIDRDGTIREANTAFLDLIEAASAEMVLGARLDRWLLSEGTGLATLLELIRSHGGLKMLPATLHGEHGAATTVEISAGTEGNLIGMVIRDVSRRLNGPSPATVEDSIRSALQSRQWATNQTSLPHALETATAIIERHYILDALDHAAGNRKAAAAAIGLSRQSLYMKMLRYGLK